MFVRVKKVGPVDTSRSPGTAARESASSRPSSRRRAGWANARLRRHRPPPALRSALRRTHADALETCALRARRQRHWPSTGLRTTVARNRLSDSAGRTARGAPVSLRWRARGVHDHAASPHGPWLRAQRPSTARGPGYRRCRGTETPASLPRHGMARRNPRRTRARHIAAAAHQGPRRGKPVSTKPRPFHRSRPRLLRYRLAVLRRLGRRDAWSVRQEQEPTQRLQAHDARDGHRQATP